MEGKRSDKVADLIHKEISEMLVRTIKDPRIGFITITRVETSEDCRLAKVYFSLTGTHEDRERSMKEDGRKTLRESSRSDPQRDLRDAREDNQRSSNRFRYHHEG